MTLRVIGAGWFRTGTYSVKLALDRLGYGPCHHMFEIRDRPELLAGWRAVADGATPEFDLLFRDYRSQMDFPGAFYWEELSKYYPDARIILTVRDQHRWIKSVTSSIIPLFQSRKFAGETHHSAVLAMAHGLAQRHVFGNISTLPELVEAHKNHIDRVKRTVPKDRLLVFDVRDGWGPLCQFLGVPTPATRFPNTNTTDEFLNVAWHPTA